MRATRFCFVLLVAGLLAAACASSSAAPTYNPYDPYADQGLATAAPATAGPFMPAASVAGFGSEATQAGYPVAGPTAAAAYATAFTAPGPESQIIKTGTISIQVSGVDASIARATNMMHGFGGWLAGSDRSTGAGQEVASVTYRIPVARFEDALAAMRTLGSKVLSEHTDSTAVGGEIVDLQARIANLKASEKAIQAIMSKANSIADVLTIQQRLAEVQGQIEQLSGQLSGLTDQSAFSTLTVVFVVPVLATPTPTPTPTPSPSPTATPVPWNAGDEAGQAAATLGEVGKGGATVVIWVAILILPVALALILLLVLIALLARALDPIRRRLLPYTVAQPVSWGAAATPQGSGSAAAPVAQSEEGPKS